MLPSECLEEQPGPAPKRTQRSGTHRNTSKIPTVREITTEDEAKRAVDACDMNSVASMMRSLCEDTIGHAVAG